MEESVRRPKPDPDVRDVLDSLQQRNESGDVDGIAYVCLSGDGVRSGVVGTFDRMHMVAYFDLLKAKLLRLQMKDDDQEKRSLN